MSRIRLNLKYKLKFVWSIKTYSCFTSASSTGLRQRPPPDPMILVIPALWIKLGGIISAILWTIPWHIERVTFPRLMINYNSPPSIPETTKILLSYIFFVVILEFSNIIPYITPTNISSRGSYFWVMSLSK